MPPSPGFVTVVTVNNSDAFGNGGGQNPGISTDGRFVAFESASTNLVSTPVSYYQAYLRDTCTGAANCTPSTRLISINDTGTGGGNNASGTLMSSVSGDGNSVVFTSQALNLISGALIHETYQGITCTAENQLHAFHCNTPFSTISTCRWPTEVTRQSSTQRAVTS